MAARLSHEPGPLGSQESQHGLQEPQELSGSKHDPNEPENIFWYTVENGENSVCLMGFNSKDADAFENDAAEDGTAFTLIGQGQHAEQQARSELDEYFHEYSVYPPTPSNDTLYYIVQTHGEEATVNGMTAEEMLGHRWHLHTCCRDNTPTVRLAVSPAAAAAAVAAGPE